MSNLRAYKEAGRSSWSLSFGEVWLPLLWILCAESKEETLWMPKWLHRSVILFEKLQRAADNT